MFSFRGSSDDRKVFWNDLDLPKAQRRNKRNRKIVPMKRDGPMSWISIHAVGSLPSGAVASFEGVNAEKAVKEVANQTKHTPFSIYIAPRPRIAGQ
jgi:hypothetical protein